MYGSRIGQNEQRIHFPRQENLHRLIGGLESFWGLLKCFKMEVWGGGKGSEGGVNPWLPYRLYVGLWALTVCVCGTARERSLG